MSKNYKENTASFIKKLKETNEQSLLFDKLETLQVNLGNICNQTCSHCHIGAGPKGDHIMDEARIEDVMLFLTNNPNLILDITGGEPSMHPQIEQLVNFASSVTKKIIVRTNLTALVDDKYKHLPEIYKQNKVEIVASMPCFSQENVDYQRGNGTFEKSILALQNLNKIKYGKNENLNLHLVYNPNSAMLPPEQKQLEKDYKRVLQKNYGIVFNNLFTMVNVPLGRFAAFLKKENQYDRYIQILKDNYNPATLDNIMCKNLISVDWKGNVYNCDFNQISNQPIINADSGVVNIRNFNQKDLKKQPIETHEHCFACTAGHGSSCTGSLD